MNIPDYTVHRLIGWLFRRVSWEPLGMTLYDRGDRYARPPTLTARTQAGLLGAHIDFAGIATRRRL